MARSDPVKQTTKLSLARALKLAAMVVDRRTTIPVLSCVRLSAPGLIAATDLDLYVMVEIDGSELGLTKKPVVVERHRLASAIKETDGSLAVCGGTTGPFIRVGDNPSVRLATNHDDLPEPSSFEIIASFALDACALADDLRAVSPAMSAEETRYYLMGMLWHVAEQKLRLAATDGHRLHLVTRPLPHGLSELPESIVPRKAIAVLAEMLSLQPGVETVECEFGATRARFTVGAVTLVTRTIDGTYPDYKRVIPENAKGGMKISARELMRPAALVQRLLSGNSKPIVVRPKDGTASAKDPEGTEISARLERELIAEPPEQVGFNSQYVMEGLAPFAGKNVIIAMDEAGPNRVEVDGDDRLLVVLMPMRV